MRLPDESHAVLKVLGLDREREPPATARQPHRPGRGADRLDADRGLLRPGTGGNVALGLLPPTHRQRPHSRQSVCADRARLHDDLRSSKAAELRARRRLHDRLVHRLRRLDRSRWAAQPRDSGRAARPLHVFGRDDRLGSPRACDRALCLSATSRRSADCAAHLGARRRVLPRELGAAALRHVVPQLRRLHPGQLRRAPSRR